MLTLQNYVGNVQRNLCRSSLSSALLQMANLQVWGQRPHIKEISSQFKKELKKDVDKGWGVLVRLLAGPPGGRPPARAPAPHRSTERGLPESSRSPTTRVLKEVSIWWIAEISWQPRPRLPWGARKPLHNWR